MRPDEGVRVETHWPGVVAIGVMYAVVFAVGVWASRQEQPDGQAVDELMLAGRRLPLWLGLLTMTATWVGGGYINGTVEYTYARGLLWGLQAPLGYSLSLVLGGLVYARTMRRHRYATLVDPLEVRFGKGPAALLMVSAVVSEVIWSAAILVALGTTFGTVIGVDLTTAIVASAAVAVGYTITGGLWSVAWTDAVQLVLIVVGLTIAAPFLWTAGGGAATVLPAAATAHGLFGVSGWREGVSYLDLLAMLLLGGVPWNVYFQRVLATPDEEAAVRLSVGGGVMCALFAVPPVLIGLAARSTDWAALGAAAGVAGVPEALAAAPSLVLPYQLRLAVPEGVGVLGMAAVAAAVMSSTDSSILSATSLLAWNGYRRLLRPDVATEEMVRLMRVLVVLVGAFATWMAVTVQSVAALWYLCGDVVYCLLFPALTLALFDPRANRTGALAGLAVGAVLRAIGGEPALGLPNLAYPVWDEAGAFAFPFRSLAMVASLLAAAGVSRLTGRWDPPRPLGPLT